MFNFLKRKVKLQHTVSTRNLAEIRRFIADGFKLVIRGAVAVLTKVVTL